MKLHDEILLAAKDFPKDFRKNLLWRYELLTRAQEDAEFKASLIKLFHENILFAFNAFFYTYDVRKRPHHHIPFMTFKEFQDETILKISSNIDKGKDLIIEKSRDEGITWLVLSVFFHKWLAPEGGGDFLLGSRKEEYVDRKGDMRTLFAKIRYILYKLPNWLIPEGLSKIHDSDRKLINPATGASITGESNNEAFSTAGRYAGVFFDEFSKWKGTDEDAWTAAGDATPCRIAVGTAFGTNNQHYRLVVAGKTEKVQVYWYLDPRKNPGAYCPWPKPLKPPLAYSDWYIAEQGRRSASEMAQEIDGYYIGSGANVFSDLAHLINGRLQDRLKPIATLRFSLSLNDFELAEVEEELTEDVLHIFQAFDEKYSYIISSDTAEGGEKADFSVIKVLCVETRDFVATFFSRLTDEVILAAILNKIWKLYGGDLYDRTTWWSVETNAGSGLAVFDLCVETYDMSKGAFMMPKLDTIAKSATTYRKGWWTSVPSRRAIIGSLKDYLHDGIGWLDARCLGEMLTFEMLNGKSQARAGSWDDDLMATGMALQVDELVNGRRRTQRLIKADEAGTASEATKEQSDAFKECQEIIARKRLQQGDIYGIKYYH